MSELEELVGELRAELLNTRSTHPAVLLQSIDTRLAVIEQAVVGMVEGVHEALQLRRAVDGDDA